MNRQNIIKAAAASNTKARATRAVRASRSPAAGVPKAKAAAIPVRRGPIVKPKAPLAAAAAEDFKQEEEEKKAPESNKTAAELAIEKTNATLQRLENFQKNSKSNALQEKMRKLQESSEIVISGVGKCEEIRDRIQAKMASKMDEVQCKSEARFMARVKQAKAEQ